MGNVPAAHSLTANEKEAVLWLTERTRPDAQWALNSDLGTIGDARLAEVGAAGCGLEGDPYPEAVPTPIPSSLGVPIPPAAGPDSRHPTGQNFHGLRQEQPPNPPSWSTWGQAGKGQVSSVRVGYLQPFLKYATFPRSETRI